MKKVILFIMTATMMSLSAQDTIPLFDQSFYFPMSNRPYDSIIFDSLYASNHHTVCRGVDCYEYPPYHLHNDWYIAYRTTKTDNLYGFAITTDTLLPEDFTIILASVTAGSLGAITPIDTFNYNDFEYHKNMFYRYMWGFPVEKETVPCQILFFNQPVVVLDTFGIKIEPTSTKYRICEQTFSNHPITPDEIGVGGGVLWV